MNHLRTKKTYLFVNKICPEPRLSSLVRIRRQQRSLILPHLINILNNNKWFTNRFPIMDKNWDFLVNGIHLKKQITFVPQILFTVLILYTLFSQCYSHSHTKWTWPEIQQGYLITSHSWSEKEDASSIATLLGLQRLRSDRVETLVFVGRKGWRELVWWVS